MLVETKSPPAVARDESVLRVAIGSPYRHTQAAGQFVLSLSGAESKDRQWKGRLWQVLWRESGIASGKANPSPMALRIANYFKGTACSLM